jgi:chemotaxis protein methyltransferase CheR
MSATITRDELTVWSRYIHEICGVFLDETKGYLLETRLGGLMRDLGAGSFSELYYKVKADVTQALRRKIIDAITTNETSFFRDATPFELLQHKLIPELIDRRRVPGGRPVSLRIWSAACSTGQEVYSTAIVLKELLGDLRSYNIQILGTDISNQALARASYGMFNQLELSRGLPADKLAKYFQAVDGHWKVRDELRSLATFRTLNLLEPFAAPAPFDLIFCRNVAIYFTETDKIRLYGNITRNLARDGALIIGSTESITGLCPEYEPKRYLRGVYYQFKTAPKT